MGIPLRALLKLLLLFLTLLCISTISCNGKTNINQQQVIAVTNTLTPSIIENISGDKPVKEPDEEFLKSLYIFTETTSELILNETQASNQIYAPINFYLTLSMFGKITGDIAQSEILTALNIDNMIKNKDELYNAVKLLETQRFTGSHLNINSSFWINESFRYDATLLSSIRDSYMTEVHPGDFSDNIFREAISNWVSQNTNQEFEPIYPFSNLNNNSNPYAFISLNTLDFYDEWSIPFEAENTAKKNFRLNNGTEISCDFMNMEEKTASYLAEDTYVSTILPLKEAEVMLLILPKEGFTTSDLLSEKGNLVDILSKWFDHQYTMGKVNLSIPKFNYKNEVDLGSVAKALGIKQIFNIESKAFSNFVIEDIYIDSIKQASKISIDEKGCSAASYTETKAFGSGSWENKIEIVLNRPFLYVLFKEDIPFLVGVVRNPLEID